VIPVIDLFAGPGGLGEGFSSWLDKKRQRLFKIALSIEMDPHARATLRLRSFFRQFAFGQAPDEYYQVLQDKLTPDDLYAKYPVQAKASDAEAWQAVLGKTDAAEVDRRIRTALNGAKDWVLIGGPPCQAYSLVGRSRRINEDRDEYEKDGRHTLYEQYLRILKVHRPPIFVMENVKGILSSKLKGKYIVEKILADLQNPPGGGNGADGGSAPLGYKLYPLADYGETLPFEETQRNPSDYIIRSELHGIPQARHRFIVLGVRNDIEWTPGKLPNVKNQISVEKAIGDLPRLRSRLSGKGSSKKENDTQEVWAGAIKEILSRIAGDKSGIVPEVRKAIRESLNNLQGAGCGGEFVKSVKQPAWERDWFGDRRIGGVCNHEARRHRKDDLWRYLFASCFGAAMEKSPTLLDFPPDLLPNHQNVKVLENDSKTELVFADRFRVQVKDRCSTTVTAHIAKDGHYFIHYDPTQCRSLTVREAARLQTFPDNYLFLGGKTEQYRQVGNAVPPLLAVKIAQVISDLFGKLQGFPDGPTG
jgi:DNA (cytosine-5)-methyltransferase 1